MQWGEEGCSRMKGEGDTVIQLTTTGTINHAFECSFAHLRTVMLRRN